MDRILKMGVCLALVVVISCPALVLAKAGRDSNISSVPAKVYDGGARVLDKTEGILNHALSRHSVFSILVWMLSRCARMSF